MGEALKAFLAKYGAELGPLIEKLKAGAGKYGQQGADMAMAGAKKYGQKGIDLAKANPKTAIGIGAGLGGFGLGSLGNSDDEDLLALLEEKGLLR